MLFKTFFLGLGLILILPTLGVQAGNGNGKPLQDKSERIRLFPMKKKKYDHIEEEEREKKITEAERLAAFLRRQGWDV